VKNAIKNYTKNKRYLFLKKPKALFKIEYAIISQIEKRKAISNRSEKMGTLTLIEKLNSLGFKQIGAES